MDKILHESAYTRDKIIKYVETEIFVRHPPEWLGNERELKFYNAVTIALLGGGGGRNFEMRIKIFKHSIVAKN
jgi:hypothetical protein